MPAQMLRRQKNRHIVKEGQVKGQIPFASRAKHNRTCIQERKMKGGQVKGEAPVSHKVTHLR